MSVIKFFGNLFSYSIQLCSDLLVARRDSVTLVVTFAPKFWECARDLQIIFCQSVSAVSVVSRLVGSGNAQTLTAVIEFVETFCTQGQWGC